MWTFWTAGTSHHTYLWCENKLLLLQKTLPEWFQGGWSLSVVLFCWKSQLVGVSISSELEWNDALQQSNRLSYLHLHLRWYSCIVVENCVGMVWYFARSWSGQAKEGVQLYTLEVPSVRISSSEMEWNDALQQSIGLSPTYSDVNSLQLTTCSTSKYCNWFSYTSYSVPVQLCCLKQATQCWRPLHSSSFSYEAQQPMLIYFKCVETFCVNVDSTHCGSQFGLV